MTYNTAPPRRPDVTLLSEVRDEQAQISDELLSLASEITNHAVESVERTGACAALAAAVIGTETEYYCLHWRNAWEKKKILAQLDADLLEKNAVGAVIVFQGSVGTSDKRRLPAVIAITRSAFCRSVKILPWHVDNDGDIRWASPIRKHRFNFTPLRSTDFN